MIIIMITIVHTHIHNMGKNHAINIPLMALRMPNELDDLEISTWKLLEPSIVGNPLGHERKPFGDETYHVSLFYMILGMINHWAY